MIAVTGATGQLGQRVITHLLTKISAEQIVAIVRSPEKATALQSKGVVVKKADYSQPNELKNALSGVDKLLLISSSEIGQRTAQHKNVIDAAKENNIKLIAYTSLLHCDTSPLGLAKEHMETESYLKMNDVPFVLLRNGWYTENYLASVGASVEHNAFIGCAKEGKISSAARDDYAEAAASVLTSDESQVGNVYELAGDEAYTLNQLADLISDMSGKKIPYVNMTEVEYQSALESAGLPEPVAQLLANSDSGAAKGGLYDNSKTLSHLINRPTSSLKSMLKSVI